MDYPLSEYKLDEEYTSNSILLFFHSSSIELLFMDFFYNKLRLFIAWIIGSILYTQFAFTQDKFPSMDPNDIFWWLGDIIIGVYFIMLSVVMLRVKRKDVLEWILLLTQITLSARTGWHDCKIVGIYEPFSPITENFCFEFAFALFIRPRVCLLFVTGFINSCTYTIYLIIIQYRNVRDLRIIVSLMSYYFNEFLIFMVVYFLNKTTRTLFKSNSELLKKTIDSNNENNKNLKLLANILGGKFIVSIKERKLNKILFEEIEKGCLIESDLVNFTLWSSKLSSKRVTKVLNYHFSFYDTICHKLKLEKVKTVGDAFYGYGKMEDMYKILLLGIGMIKSVKLINNYLEDSNFEIRVGAATGDFVVSVLGSIESASLSFDVFGSLYNKVKRLEEVASMNSINVSQDLYFETADEFCFKTDDDTYSIQPFSHRHLCITNRKYYKELCLIIRSCKKQFFERDINYSSDDDNISFKDINLCNMQSPYKYIFRTLSFDDSNSNNGSLMKPIRKKITIDSLKKCWNHCSTTFADLFTINTDWKCYEVLYLSNIHLLCNIYIYFFLFNIIVLSYFLFTNDYYKEFLNVNVVIISAFVNMFVEFLSVLISRLAVRYYKDFIKVYYVVYYPLTLLNLILLRIEFLLLNFLPLQQNNDLFRYFVIILIIFLVYSGPICMWFRLGFVLIDAVLVVLKLYLYYDEESEDLFVLNIQDYIIGILGLIYCVTVKERNIKKTLEKRKIIEKRNLQLQEDKKKNKNLILCVLPQDIVNMIFDNQFHSFSINIEKSFAVFFKIDHFNENLNGKCRIDSITFLSNLFLKFDEYVRNGGICMTIKKIQAYYLFISKDIVFKSTPSSILNDVFKVIENSVHYFQESSKKMNDKLDFDLELKIGMSFGKFGGGVLGTEKWLFDVFGFHINLASRLCNCNISENCEITVCDENMKDIVDENKNVELIKRKRMVLKGIGERSLSFLRKI